MTDLYIKTPTQADYDALMRLAEAAGDEWYSKHKPTNLNCYTNHNERSVVKLPDDRKLLISSVERFELEGRKIETIPNLADIKAIWKVTRDNRIPFIATKRLPDHYKSAKAIYVIQVGDSTVYTNEDNDFKAALAVEYKPQESVIMSEKVKLPKEIYEVLRNIYGIPEAGGEDSPLSVISDLTDFSKEEDGYGVELGRWLEAGGAINQWKLIDALRNGYESEPEQLYYVQFTENDKFGYLNIRLEDGSYKADSIRNDSHFKTQFTMPEIIAMDPRYKAFAVPVEEVDGYESKNCD